MIAILTSGVALGVHVPGLLLADRLRERGVDVHISVLERLLPEETLATTDRTKWAFHSSFRTALAGQKLAGTVTVPPDALAAEVGRWHELGVTRLVVFSGFWLPLLEGVGIPVDVVHVDSVESPSFQKAGTPTFAVRKVWLADADEGTIPCSIPVSHDPVVPWTGRSRLLLHGGGWGMGTYRDQVPALLAAGFGVDVVAHTPSDVTEPDVRYFMVDPAWHPWHDDGYPPFGRNGEFARGEGHHGSYDVSARAIATVSKPGGGTLLDSLWSATPAVFLEPFGAHESRNADLWIKLGFGISFDDWRAQDFSVALLRSCHEALREARDSVADYSAVLR